VAHKMTSSCDCRDPFKRALLLQSAKMLRLNRCNRTTNLESIDSPGEHESHVGGEAKKEPNNEAPLRAFRMSLSTRVFNHARGLCLNVPENLRNETAESVLSGVKALRVDQATETNEFDLVTESKGNNAPIRISCLRKRRSSFYFGPHLFLITGVKATCTWIASHHSPYRKRHNLLKEVQTFREGLEENRALLAKQYIPESEAKADSELIESAYYACKQQSRDALTPYDIENAMIRAGVSNIGDPKSSWYDLVREFDFDNTGFMEYNEFYLLCHHLTSEQLRRLTYISIPGLMKLEGGWTEVCLDFDAWKGTLSIYADLHSFVKTADDRTKLKRVPGKVWDLPDVTKIKRRVGVQMHSAPVWTVTGDASDQYDFVIDDSDTGTFTKMINHSMYVAEYNSSGLRTMIDTSALLHLAHSASHAFIS
jgi:hypothetical protein